jgi:hypothetical protein
MEDRLLDILALIVIVLPFISVWSAYKLWRIARNNRGVVALTERAKTAGVLAIVSVFSAILAVNRLWPHDDDYMLIQRPWPALISIGLLALSSVPNILWAFEYKKDHFGDGR